MFRKFILICLLVMFTLSISSTFGQTEQTKRITRKEYQQEMTTLNKEIKTTRREYQKKAAELRKEAIRKQAALGRDTQNLDERRAIMKECAKKQAELRADYTANKSIILEELREVKKAYLKSNREKYLPNAKEMKLRFGKKE